MLKLSTNHPLIYLLKKLNLQNTQLPVTPAEYRDIPINIELSTFPRDNCQTANTVRRFLTANSHRLKWYQISETEIR